MAERRDRDLQPADKIRLICRRDPRYRPEAYFWIFEALEHTLRGLPAPRHVTGQELCHGVRSLALERFGPLARVVLECWGITRTEDIGRMVFHLIDVELMGRTETDSIADFDQVFEFAEAFAPGAVAGVRLHDVFCPPPEPSPRLRAKEPALF
jgi:uncharacterized repeat protein (TIGR04138 family)